MKKLNIRFYKMIRSALLMALPLSFSPTLQAEDSSRAWDLWARTFIAYDTNTPLVSNSIAFAGDENSLGGGIELDGEYRFINQQALKVGTGLYFYQSAYTEDGADSFDLTTVAPRLFAKYRFRFLGLPSQIYGSYTYRQDFLDHNDFEDSHQFRAKISVKREPGVISELRLGVMENDFDNQGAISKITSRDGNRYGIGIGETYSIYQGGSIRWGYDFYNNNADGKNFEYYSHQVGLRFVSTLPFEFLNVFPNDPTFILAGKYEKREYHDFVISPKRDQNIWQTKGTLIFPINDHIELDASYGYLQFNGNAKIFDADRHRAEIGISYIF